MAMLELAGLLVLVLVGIVVIVMIKAFLFLLPAAVIAAVVWFLTRGEPQGPLLTGVAFLAVALVSLVKRR